VRDHFWLVFLTATLSLILEETAIHVGAAVGLLITDSDSWGEWAGGTLAASFATPLAALATSVTYQRLATRGASRVVKDR